ncbi:hypothetical protein ACIQFP_26675 [Nocardiopsis alba]|uniref:hypothetical protein n=1 Tax=Nocardiopsis alba TaxID=53437 RepID=UPI00382F72D6
MSLATLTDLLAGAIRVRVDRRTVHGLEPVTAGRLVDGDRRGNRVRLVDEVTHQLIEVSLTSSHVVAYTPTTRSV